MHDYERGGKVTGCYEEISMGFVKKKRQRREITDTDGWNIEARVRVLWMDMIDVFRSECTFNAGLLRTECSFEQLNDIHLCTAAFYIQP